MIEIVLSKSFVCFKTIQCFGRIRDYVSKYGQTCDKQPGKENTKLAAEGRWLLKVT